MFIWGSSSICSKLGLFQEPIGTELKSIEEVAMGAFLTKIHQYRVDYFSHFCEKRCFVVQ